MKFVFILLPKFDIPFTIYATLKGKIIIGSKILYYGAISL